MSACVVMRLSLGERTQRCPALGLSNAKKLRYAPARSWYPACEKARSSVGESRVAPVLVRARRRAGRQPMLDCNGAPAPQP